MRTEAVAARVISLQIRELTEAQRRNFPEKTGRSGPFRLEENTARPGAPFLSDLWIATIRIAAIVPHGEGAA
jgi:hypothetical protein